MVAVLGFVKGHAMPSFHEKKSKSSFDWFRGGDVNQGEDIHNEYPIAKISSPFSFQSLLEQETHLKTLGIESLYNEDEYIENGILKLIKQHGIRELVMGAAADEHCLSWTIRSKKVKSGKAVHVRDNAPPFCHIWFICNGQLVHIREGDNPPVSSPGKDVTVSAERDGGAGSPAVSCDLLTSRFNTNNIDAQEFASVCQSLPSSVFQLQNESVCSKHDHIHDQLEHAIKEAENYCRDAFENSMRLLKAEKEALRDTICKAETADRLYHEEVGRRKEIEETLAIVKDALAALKVERESTSKLWRKDLDELRETKFQKSALESLVEKSNISLKELQEKFLSEMKLSRKYKNENEELQMERNNALKEAEKLRKQLEQVLSSSHVSDCISAFSYSDLEKATKFFHPSLKIGEGGYGSIYKGFLRHTEVAMKILNPNSSQGPRKFDQEVDVLLKLRHPNVVTLVGACQESCALVYEYLPGGSLEDRLNCKNNAPPLPWQTRIRVATELCSALLFLHSNRSGCIIHGDLKPANVLLDGNSVCKLGDFGICRMVSSGKTSVDETTFIFTTQPKGTLPYLDPEFLSTGELTPKSDVYSFGIILLRLLTGKSALGIARDVGYALRKGTLGSMLDPSAGDWPFLRAEQLARIALGCCELNRKDRPDLGSDVWRILEPMNSSCQNLSILRLPCENQIPTYFICPIFQEIMKDPHMASDGFTYEGEAIRGWLDSGHDRSPMTNATLENQNLTPNHALRSSIQEWLQHNLTE